MLGEPPLFHMVVFIDIDMERKGGGAGNSLGYGV